MIYSEPSGDGFMVFLELEWSKYGSWINIIRLMEK